MKLKSLLTLLIILCSISLNVLAQKGGEIVFSKNMIDSSNPTELTAKFQAGDHIYSVAFLEKSI